MNIVTHQHATPTELRTAAFSLEEEPLHRYALQITWDEARPILVGVCLNPSKATHLVNDPTVTRMCQRATLLGAGSYVMLNAFAFRSTKPEGMKAAADPVGPENDAMLRHWFRMSAAHGWSVLFGWGNHGVFLGRHKAVLALARDAGVTPMCLAINEKTGQPKHPLYCAYAAPLIPYELDGPP